MSIGNYLLHFTGKNTMPKMVHLGMNRALFDGNLLPRRV